jgi:hypothetical protein
MIKPSEINIPPEAARAFLADMRAYFAERFTGFEPTRPAPRSSRLRPI